MADVHLITGFIPSKFKSRGITLSYQYTMIKLSSKFRGGPRDPPPMVLTVVGYNNMELKGYEMTERMNEKCSCFTFLLQSGIFQLQFHNKLIVWNIILASLSSGAYRVDSRTWFQVRRMVKGPKGCKLLPNIAFFRGDSYLNSVQGGRG